MKVILPCAIYTRKSSEEGLEQGFNSLDAQREACEAFILSQKAQGWVSVCSAYDDGGFSGGNTERPALKRLIADIEAGQVRIIVVYKVDRLTRSLADFAKLVELFDAKEVSFVSVTQQFNTTSSMGRLTLNVLLSFAQFEREVTGERIRDKIAASKRKGLWMGGLAPIGYLPHERTLVIDEPQAQRVRELYRLYLDLGCVRQLKAEVDRRGWATTVRKTRRADAVGGRPFSRGHLYRILSNPVYVGQIAHKGALFAGQHPAIVDVGLWQAVQDGLRANVQGHQIRATAMNPSLLTGLVFDDQGQRLTPTHARKGARRYRYYVSQQLLTKGREAVPEALRWPAQELEQCVLQALTSFLTDASRLMEFMADVDPGTVKGRLSYARGLSKTLASAKSADRIVVLRRIVEKITIFPDKLKIAVNTGAIWSSDPILDDDKATTLIEVPVELRRSGMAVRLILRAPGEGEPRNTDPKLVSLLAKARDWFDRLSSGRSDSLQSIAHEEGVTSAYVSRVVNLAFLAPDIVHRLTCGEGPRNLNSDRLIRMGPFPNSWDDQKVLLGLSR